MATQANNVASSYSPKDYIPRQHDDAGCTDVPCKMKGHSAPLSPGNFLQDSGHLYVKDALSHNGEARHTRIVKWYKKEDPANPVCFQPNILSRIQAVHNAILRAVSVSQNTDIDPADVTVQLINEQTTAVFVKGTQINGDIKLLDKELEFLPSTEKTVHAAMVFLYAQILNPEKSSSPGTLVPGQLAALPAIPIPQQQPVAEASPLPDDDEDAISDIFSTSTESSSSIDDESDTESEVDFTPPQGVPGNWSQATIDFVDSMDKDDDKMDSLQNVAKKLDIKSLKKPDGSYYTYRELRLTHVPEFRKCLKILSENPDSKDPEAKKVLDLLQSMHYKAAWYYVGKVKTPTGLIEYLKKRDSKSSEVKLLQNYYWDLTSRTILSYLISSRGLDLDRLSDKLKDNF